jgi:hypothetical protein
MKKTLLLSLFAMGLFAFSASAQTSKPTETVPVFSIADSAAFTGKYKYEGLPFEYMEVSVKEGKLFYNGGEYSGFLDPLKDKKDAFDASGAAVFTFNRNAENKVTELRIDYQGQTFTGRKEDKKS